MLCLCGLLLTSGIDWVEGFCEYSGRSGEPHDWAVVGIAPRKLDCVKFFVAVLHLRCAVGDEDENRNERVIRVCEVLLDSEYRV